MGTGAREQHLLPAGGGLSRKGRRGQLGTGARPEIGDVGTRIGAGLVEADASNGPVHVRAEFHPQLHRAVGSRVHHGQGPSCRARA